MCAHNQSFGRSCQIAFKELYHFPLQWSMNENVFSHAPWYCIESMFIIFIIWYFNDIGTSLPWLASLFPTEPSCEMTEWKLELLCLGVCLMYYLDLPWHPRNHGRWCRTCLKVTPTRNKEARVFFYLFPIYQWIEHCIQGPWLWHFWLSLQAYSLSRKKGLRWRMTSVLSHQWGER